MATTVHNKEQRALEKGGLDQRRIVTIGIALSILVHAALAIAFARLDESGALPPLPAVRRSSLCTGGLRCPAVSWKRPRMELDQGPMGDVLIAQVIPALGLAQQDPKKLPELQKYEQPEKVEDGINIEEENPPPVEPPKPKEFEKKEEQRDKRAKVPLANILAPDSDDPRKRATGLDRIIGRADGMVGGTGTEWGPGDRWAGEVQIKLMQEFRVPASIDTRALQKLVVQIKITKVSAEGAIEGYEIVKKSSNEPYNTATLQLVKRFMPIEGGPLKLPKPESKVLAKVNRDGMLITLDGKLFRGR